MASDDGLWRLLGAHFYQAARGWAVKDGDPPEALVEDRFMVAAQDALELLPPSPAEVLRGAIGAVERAWAETCCGNRNVAACESCRAYQDVVEILERRLADA